MDEALAAVIRNFSGKTIRRKLLVFTEAYSIKSFQEILKNSDRKSNKLPLIIEPEKKMFYIKSVFL
jgi:hypothetical protein